MTCRRYFMLLVLLSLGLASQAHSAPTVEIAAQLEPEAGAVPGQRIRLHITVATPRWFTAGTRLSLPEVPGLILLQNQSFASNASEQRDGHNWSLQRWTVDVFATRAGSFLIPPVTAKVSTSLEGGLEYQGELTTPPLPLSVVLPPALEGLEHWIASPEVTLTQSIDSSGVNDAGLPLGGALTRTLTVTAQDVMAMQLPELATAAASLVQQYPEPPVLRNRANRGRLSAERRDRSVLIATAPGKLNWPGAQLNWWNTDTGELTVLTTEPVTVMLSGEQLTPESSHSISIEPIVDLTVTVILAWLGVLAWRKGLGARIKRIALALLRYAQGVWRQHREPGLPERLNPGGNPRGP